MASKEIKITGYVQGVGFRGYVKQTAFANGIKGETWNARGGSVRVIAQHDDEAVLKRFEEEMWNGPGRVDEVRVEEGPSRVYPDFQVTETR
jgi:acylphosphatase